MKLQAMVGYKIFKELDDDTIELLRVYNVRRYKDGGVPAEITVKNEGTGEVYKIRTDTLSQYTPLEPDGLMTFNVVSIRNSMGERLNDVIVTASRTKELHAGDDTVDVAMRLLPFAVCRQNITDVFYNILAKDESAMMVGLAVNQNDCPTNFDFRFMLGCDSIDYSDYINIYRNDTLEDIYPMVKMNKFDEVLSDLYQKHVEYVGNPVLQFKSHDRGWCKDLKTLLQTNSFQTDINEMLDITEVDFSIQDHMVTRKSLSGHDYQSISDNLIRWFSDLYKVLMERVMAIPYGHDIDLSSMDKGSFFLIRDNTKTLYVMAYTVSGEAYQQELEELDSTPDFSTTFRLKFYNKYN